MSFQASPKRAAVKKGAAKKGKKWTADILRNIIAFQFVVNLVAGLSEMTFLKWNLETTRKLLLKTVTSENSLPVFSLWAQIYHIYCIYLDRQTWANSEDPYEMPQNVAPHQGLHCLTLIQQFLDTTLEVNCTCSKFRITMLRSWGVPILRVNTLTESIMKTHLFKYIENFTSKNLNFSDKKKWYLSYFCSNIDCGYSLELPRRGGSNEYPESVFEQKQNIVYPCKPQFYYIKVGFKGVKIL